MKRLIALLAVLLVVAWGPVGCKVTAQPVGVSESKKDTYVCAKCGKTKQTASASGKAPS